MLRFSLLPILFLLWNTGSAQFAPAAGEPGSTAIWKDSTIFKAWATSAEIFRGPLQVGADSLGVASAGEPELATGAALSNGLVSLGDGGQAILTFPFSIKKQFNYGWNQDSHGFRHGFRRSPFSPCHEYHLEMQPESGVPYPCKCEP
jgi:hypothetical protein